MGFSVMISCREVSTLVAGDALAESPWRRRLAVRAHLLMCAACRGFAAQMEAIRRGARAAGRAHDDEAAGIEQRSVRAMQESRPRT